MSLINGVLIIAASPLIAYATLVKGCWTPLLSLGAMLLIYCVVGAYSINKAWKLFL